MDGGGPSREYLRLLLHEIGNNSSLLCGPDNCRTAMHNTSALHKEEFLCVGRCIVLSILFNGPGPHFFCETAANYLLGIPIMDVPHNDIPDPEICDRIIQVCCNCSKCIYLKPVEGIFFFSFYFLNKD